MAQSSRLRMRSTIAVLTAIIVVAVAACGSGSSSSNESAPPTTAPAPSSDPLAPRPLPERESLTISMTVKIEPFAPAMIAQAMGEFEKENLDVEIITLPPNEASLALNQGSVAVHLDGISAAFLNNKSQGNDLVWVGQVHQLPSTSKEGFWVRKEMLNSSGDLDPDKIPGMRIAFGAGGIGVAGALPIATYLDTKGFSLNDVEAVALGGADGLIALENDSVDASWVITPFWLQLDNPDSCCAFIDAWPGGFSASVYVMDQSFIEAEPAVARAIFRAIARTIETYLTGDYHNDPVVMAALSAELGVPEATIKASPSLVFDPNFGFDTKVVQQIQEMWIEVGDILSYREPIPQEQLIDNQVVLDMLAGL